MTKWLSIHDALPNEGMHCAIIGDCGFGTWSATARYFEGYFCEGLEGKEHSDAVWPTSQILWWIELPPIPAPIKVNL